MKIEADERDEVPQYNVLLPKIELYVAGMLRSDGSPCVHIKISDEYDAVLFAESAKLMGEELIKQAEGAFKMKETIDLLKTIAKRIVDGAARERGENHPDEESTP